jgi:hypothetical protein
MLGEAIKNWGSNWLQFKISIKGSYNEQETSIQFK